MANGWVMRVVNWLPLSFRSPRAVVALVLAVLAGGALHVARAQAPDPTPNPQTKPAKAKAPPAKRAKTAKQETAAAATPGPTTASNAAIGPETKPGKRPERRIARPAPPLPPTVTPPTPAEQRQQMLAPVASWGFQLRQIRFPEIAASPLDLVVIDHALSGGRRFLQEFSPEQIRQLRSKPDGRRRLVLAYLSIGEAERYRFYWKPDWFDGDKKPAWLGDLNTVWDGNYLVRFWDPDWQRLIFGTPQSYLERIKAAGFDGIYIDRADAHAEWTATYPEAEKAMVSFITNLAQTARANDPFFLVVLQNAEELVAHKAIVDAIDGLAKEDLFYGIDHKATPNDPSTVDWSLQQLRKLKRANRRILVVEYLADAEKAALARRRAEAEGFVIHFTNRDLGELTLRAPDQPATAAAPQATAPSGPVASPGALPETVPGATTPPGALR
ncbi:MAG: MJ1477/TM1410 family putative glycoside hydrolase [Hyphomicrobiaceae bacterium]